MRSDRERLVDILESANKIHSRVQRGRAHLDADEDLQIVLTHLVQVIGEAAARISDELSNRYPNVPWRQVVGMRNRIVHDYFDVDLEVLWITVSDDVPRLAQDVEIILQELLDQD